ncbi:MAG: sugar transferase [Ignavibacteria bacterium]|nr:sugar transferase [Ignavibacteria bacterium]
MSGQNFYQQYGKRLFDLCFAVVGIVVLAPLMGVISLIIYFTLGSPIIFKQKRPGLREQPFMFYKFRTMKDLFNQDDKPLPDSKRVTPLGVFLRSTSLDELPSLINVLLGNMSVVGPRPLLVEYLALYNKTQKQRHDVKPGLTGWAQINGRNAISWEEKFNLDVSYVNSYSFWLDLKIMLITILQVIKREGINQPYHVTMEKFSGNK